MFTAGQRVSLTMGMGTSQKDTFRITGGFSIFASEAEILGKNMLISARAKYTKMP